jgi:hypothetical protein
MYAYWSKVYTKIYTYRFVDVSILQRRIWTQAEVTICSLNYLVLVLTLKLGDAMNSAVKKKCGVNPF